MRTSRRSPASSATRSQCRPAQLIRKSRFELARRVVGDPSLADARRRSTRAPVDHLAAARPVSATSASHTAGNRRCLPAARAAPPRRPRAARSRASPRGPATAALPGRWPLPRSCRPRRRGTSLSSAATTSLPQTSCGTAVLLAERHHLPDSRHRQPRLRGAGLVVEPAMEHAAVVPGLVPAHGGSLSRAR